ncbi:EAL domain-containing protein [Oribacterium sp. WCC10]|uniref:EAL domain-containing protein n=1 Tax=Oribacterium sp. WCC10 TaxID=1855343 RepID=UPI0008E230AF|nr:EAL domain-containing protein [Oribacterium sp. WCC10]SFG31417.1 PAS domain S-box-containing protein [Oribacterium sp. WCC10]
MQLDEFTKDYILSNIDKAISEGWIEPYFQPIIRSYTGELCSVEILARWIDPERGMISPALFIPVLEENGISYKLDLYIATRAITTLQYRLRHGLSTVPVSINISRSDFEHCDPARIIADACDKHGVRHDMIAIEITETAIISDNGLIKSAIERFHKAGFEVLMDDFGSGYSSLNVLKDFDFDEIKIDMGFLRDFNEKSKTIVTMAVRMAKNLGIHTLAEGVETKEHLDFLRGIGCERIQGYYYGAPKALNDAIANLEAKNICIESRESYTLYQKVGLIDVMTDTPLALFFYDGHRFENLFINDAYMNEVPAYRYDTLKTIDIGMNSLDTPLSRKFRDLADNASKSGKKEVMTFVYFDKYFHFSFVLAGKARKGVVLSAELDGKVYNRIRISEYVDKILRNVASIYECIYLLDLENKTRTVIVSNVEGESEGDVIPSTDIFTKGVLKGRLYCDEELKWNIFSNKEYILDRIEQSGEGYFSDFFLVKKDDGNYVWMEMLLLSVNEKRDDKILLCIRPAPIESLTAEGKRDYVKRILKYGYLTLDKEDALESDIWKSLVDESNLRLFWKDKDRRFLGASRSFRKYYGFTSDEDFIGKTDEEMGWHLNDAPFASDEYDVLTKGEAIYNASTINVVDGVSHHIIASKIPIYSDNHIVGLVGYMVDADYDVIADGPKRDLRFVDPVTGFMNAQGLMNTLAELDNNYRTNGETYTYIALHVDGYSDVLVDYGGEVAMKLLKEIAAVIKKSFSDNAAISRNEGARFGICERNKSIDLILNCISECMTLINSITEIDSRKCRLSVHCGTANGLETEGFNGIAEVATNRLRKARRLKNADNLLEGEVLPDLYKDMPLPAVMVRPHMGKGDKAPKDMIFVFVNKAYCDMTGKSREDLLGHGYLEVFPQTDKNWIDMTYKAVKGDVVHSKLYDGATHHWLRFAASPADEPGTCFVICDVCDDEKAEA